MERPETRYAVSGDVNVAYQVTGSGPVDLVWAPGTASHLDMDWDLVPKARFLRLIGQFCRLIRFDKRGTGLSDRVSGAATLEERSDDIRAVMDAAGSDRAFLFGLSEGANMACLFAATHPDRASGLMTWGGQARWEKTPDYPWGWTPEQIEAEISDLATYGVTEGYITGAPEKLPLPKGEAAWLDFMIRYYQAGASPSALAALERMNQGIDVRDVLPMISVPTLIMHGTEDQVAHIDAARDMASHIAGAKFVTFPGGHRFWLDESAADAIAAEMEEFMTGAKTSRSSRDRILATVLFTDIVDSTKHLALLGDRVWRERVAAHYDIIREAIDIHRGREIDTAGDGFFATFDGPARAVNCAMSIVKDLHRLRIDIRAGLHTGECEVSGDKVGGMAVHIGARIAALAGPSEILVSSTVKDLTAGSGITYQDAGKHQLKGVPDRWRLYRAVVS